MTPLGAPSVTLPASLLAGLVEVALVLLSLLSNGLRFHMLLTRVQNGCSANSCRSFWMPGGACSLPGGGAAAGPPVKKGVYLGHAAVTLHAAVTARARNQYMCIRYCIITELYYIPCSDVGSVQHLVLILR